MVRTASVPGPAASVTPLADQFEPTGIASTQVVPPSALTWIFSPARQRAGEGAAHRLRRHAGDKVTGRAGVGA